MNRSCPLRRFGWPADISRCRFDTERVRGIGEVSSPLRRRRLKSDSALFLAAVGRRFYADNCLRHASALAYTTLLSLVPLLALMFSILKGLGVQRRLEPILLSRLALDQTVVDQIIGFIDNTNVGTLGALGAAALVLTVHQRARRGRGDAERDLAGAARAHDAGARSPTI